MKIPSYRSRFLPVALLILGALWTVPPTAQGQDTLVQTTVHRFAGSEGSNPNNLILGADGNFYGTTNNGGIGYVAGQPASGFGTAYRLTLAGELTTLYRFTGGADGSSPRGLIQGADGNLYGVTALGGANASGTVFRLTTTGALTTIYSQTTAAGAGTLVQGPDGNFYGLGYNGSVGAPLLFRLTQAGEYTALSTFSNRYSSPVGLVLASDGNFYGTTNGAGNSSGGIYRQRIDGTSDYLHTLSASDGLFPNGLTLGRDGNLYGTTQTQGGHGNGTACRITPAGEFTLLYRFPEGNGNFPVHDLVLGGDGNFYGVTYGIGRSDPPDTTVGRSTVFRLTPSGELTTLYASPTTVGAFVLGPDGSFYGTQSSSSDAGTVFKLTTVPHPAFFTGQVPLLDSVEYLAFLGGNYFGYYVFLSDPRYIYHFDLGYEYVIDANDGQGGVYFYDFTSGDFFYTGSTLPFPYLYDFDLETFLYYYPDPDNPGRYNTNGVRYFYNFRTGKIIRR